MKMSSSDERQLEEFRVMLATLKDHYPPHGLIHCQNQSTSRRYRASRETRGGVDKRRTGTIAKIFASSPRHPAFARGLVVAGRQTEEVRCPCATLPDW